MITVYKYAIESADSFTLMLPADAVILSVKVQNYRPFLWALIDTDKPVSKRSFILTGTGQPIAVDANNWNKLHFIGMFQLDELKLVFHLFEVKNNIDG